MTRFPILLTAPLAAWAAFEVVLVLRDLIRRKGRAAADRGSRYVISGGLYAGFLLSAVLSRFSRYSFPGEQNLAALAAAILVVIIGLGLRIWAVATLGSSFRLTVETHENQAVVDHGPYRLVRHPAYSGLLLICLGFGLGFQNWLSLAAAIILPTAAILYRVRVEERVLAASIGVSYQRYQERTKKLVPWIW